MQKFKESAFLLSEILRHKVAPLQFDIYSLELTKIRKNRLETPPSFETQSKLVNLPNLNDFDINETAINAVNSKYYTS